ncbi:hypothetical protein [Streptomyces xinghaiensis]|uniref:hypothetical protein n=1 Tax=Streptomyces xinghaiensis TaxID=1038928 RepID=UPI001EDD861E|nr:hypothetical protein [Streptomyces xinghaiensis]
MRTLLDVAGSDGVTDAVRLAVVVLAARTPSVSGVVEIRTGELGRWLGLSASYVASRVVPALRRSGIVAVDTAEGEFGQDVGLACRVLPLWQARRTVGHPLCLRRTELATLLRLVEAVMAPGWRHRDGRVTPAGLLGSRTGRGAATDRLALLLLVLEARETGRVRQCGGVVDTKRGRAAATVARLLGCTASAGEQVLERLEGRGLVRRARVRTASGLAHRTRLMVPAVAAAHGHRGLGAVKGGGAVASNPAFSEPDGTAGPVETPEPAPDSQVSGVPVAAGPDGADPDATAALHTHHPAGGSPVSSVALSGGFSGEGRGGSGVLPDRACAREDQAAGRRGTAGPAAPPVASVGPLRGEKPQKSPVDEPGQRPPARPQPGRCGEIRRAGLPADLRLRVALTPVAGLWAQLNRWQQHQVERAAAGELTRLAGVLARPETASQLLADRLTDRLGETGGEALVRSPFGWLIHRGLVQRPACSDPRCDDGIRLDTGAECDTCGNVIHIRRAERARIAAQVEAQLPGLGVLEHRQVLEERLREQAAIKAEAFARRREHAIAEQARRDAARVAARERAERERRAAAAAEAARQGLSCQDCGRSRSAGLCEACGYRRRTEALIVEAGHVAATWTADLNDAKDVAAVAAGVRATMEAEIATAREKFLRMAGPADLDADPSGNAAVLAFGALQTTQQAALEYRRCALAMLSRTEEAEAEARRAYTTEQNRRWFRTNPHSAHALAAAAKAADAARQRTAQYLLDTRLAQLHGRPRPETAGSAMAALEGARSLRAR